MSTLAKILLIVFVSCYLFIHLYTLPLNPLPWFDETFFASVSKSVAEHGTLVPEITKETFSDEKVLTYGPVHFLLEATSFKSVGFGISQYRIVTLLFGLLTVIATGLLISFYHQSSKILVLLLVTFALDPFVNLSMHEGRMDLVCIFFMILSILFLLKGIKEEKTNHYLLSGLFAAISLLTTPRIGFLFVASGIGLLLSLEGKPLKQALLTLLWWALPVIVLYLAWTFYAFGGVVQLYNYYANLHVAYGEYVGGRWYVPKHEYPLIALTLLSVVYGIATRKLNYFSPGVIISLASIISFYFVVLDWGPYSALILPFYYFLFFHGFNNPQLAWKNISIYPLMALLIFNVFFFTIKSAQVISEASIRDAKSAHEFIRTHIPPGSKVIGDPQYYYAVVQSGSHYRLYDVYLSAETREKVLREVYDYDYLILSDRYLIKDPLLAEVYFKNARLKKVGELKMEPSELSKKINALGITSSAESYGYNAQIFVRIKEEKSWVGMVQQR